VLGIDPGSRSTGYAILDTDGFRHQYVTSGHLVIQGESLAEKLGIIFTRVTELIEEWQPEAMAIEQVFMQRNADSALKLGQARGAAICAAVQAKLPVGEYSPRAIKKAVVGTGTADKKQIQKMMKLLLELDHVPQSDAADALAIAMCHANHLHVQSGVQVRGVRRGRWV
jgi:crossover junction endodeoxyribonuclease RuvC